MRYIHLCAEVNGQLKDVLVDEDMMEEVDSIEDFFLSGAKDVANMGLVEVEAVEDRHVLPESFGVD